MLISVIVPVYNVEDYLHYAMDSLINQTYKNFEVILVNDGSTDNSGEICNQYAEQYENVYVYHKENGGLSDARNFGVEKSQGEFITFLDPDDYLEEFGLELLIGIQKKNNADMVSTRVKTTEVYENYSSYKLKENDYKNVIIMDRNVYLEEAFYDKVATVSACGKLYKRASLKTPFPIGKIYEDMYIVSEQALKIDKIAHSSIQIYNYYRRPGSIVNSKFSEKQYDFFKAIQHNRKIIKSYYANDSKLQNAVTAKEVIGAFKISSSASNSSMRDVKKIRDIIVKDFKSFMTNPHVSIKIKCKYLLFIISSKMFYKLKSILGK